MKGYKDEKLSKNQKIVSYIMFVVLLVSALAYALVRKQVFGQKVHKAQSEVKYYENDECLSKSD